MPRNMTSKDISVITECAKRYAENLCNRNLLFFYRRGKVQERLEVAFYSRNYSHLTGVIHTGISSELFYTYCLNNRLDARKLQMAPDGTTVLKLSVINALMRGDLSARMIGIYDGSRPMLYTEVLAGGVKGCIGFCKDKNGIFVPNTLLKGDIRDISQECFRVECILRKAVQDKEYTDVVYTAKGVQEPVLPVSWIDRPIP